MSDTGNSNFPDELVVQAPPNGEIPLATPAGSQPPAQTVLDPIPPLREVRARVVQMGEGETEVERSAVLLEDPDGFATQPAALSTWAYALALFFDGKRNAMEAVEAFKEKYGQVIQPEQALLLQNELEQACFLNSSSFEDGLQKRLNQYLEMTFWTPVHAGSAYPADPETLRTTFKAFFTSQDGPGKLSDTKSAATHTNRALMVPHIDLRVGGATYAHAYNELLESSQAELIVILGVAHQHMGEQLYSVSQKDFETPLGKLFTNREMALRLHEASGADDVMAEMAHRGEHSIEFQAVLLQTMLAEHCQRKIEIVPILCGPVETLLQRGHDPFKDEEFLRFTEALRKELENCGKKWCVMCSVDLSHVGPEFGHSSMIDERVLKPLERMDLRLLNTLEKLDAEAFYGEIARTQNSRHVDAVLAVMTMLAACRGMLKSGKLLHYDQMLKDASHSAVSYAAMSFDAA